MKWEVNKLLIVTGNVFILDRLGAIPNEHYSESAEGANWKKWQK